MSRVFFTVCELLNFASLEKTRTRFPYHQRRNFALPASLCLVQLCQSELSRSATSSTGENGHFLFLNRKIVNPAKKKKKETVCGFWCFSWVQNARKRSFRFAKLELPVSIFLTRNKMFVNIGPLWHFIVFFRFFLGTSNCWDRFFQKLWVPKRSKNNLLSYNSQ